MVWGCITYGVGKLVFVDGNMNSESTFLFWTTIYGKWSSNIIYIMAIKAGYTKMTMHPVTSQDNLKIGNIGTKFHN